MNIPLMRTKADDENLTEALNAQAKNATDFLKAIAHEGRLMILCHLVDGEKSVTSLETLLDLRQAAVSQQLSRLRLEGLVTSRREGKTIYYALADARVVGMISALHSMFCADNPA
ncbi:metalloregulator ArsR/SmtB family transcription factor [Abyssibius alkaniclasticus]|uniref:ArsR/SmtB family transcription factor n=1 Tax=Abyssibius alkaniclasticus TaxID=2881234 RepID=UPI0023648DFB|nr:metalloregulator ArsR/SmtB family transcription factor [Abyssibius alkaniclasticus]UPH71431.1 metalloregulator ArsR/SmtB family transcription factor [Abyssibius alkaniclasticus]